VARGSAVYGHAAAGVYRCATTSRVRARVGEAGMGVSAGTDTMQAGPASALGPEKRRRPDKVEKVIFFSK
jgi:hypothetical protein